METLTCTCMHARTVIINTYAKKKTYMYLTNDRFVPSNTIIHIVAYFNVSHNLALCVHVWCVIVIVCVR